MAKKILVAVEKRLFRKTLQEALLVAQKGDTLVLDPGTYTFLQGRQIFHSITIEGAGEFPEDVLLQGSIFWNQAMQKVTIKNLTIESPAGNNAINVKNQGQLEANGCIIKGEFAGEYPAIYSDSSRVELHNCDVDFNNKETGILLKNGSDGYIESCALDSIFVEHSSLLISNSRIRTMLRAEASTVKSNDYTEYLQANPKKYSFYMENGSKVELARVNAPEKDVYASVSNSLLSIQQLDIFEDNPFTIHKYPQAVVQIPDDPRIMIYEYDEEGNLIGEPTQQATATQTYTASQSAETTSFDEEEVTFDDFDDYTEDSYEAQPAVEKTPLEQLQALYGLETVKKQALKFIKNVQFNRQRLAEGRSANEINLHSLFLGNPGTGKTTVARLLGQVLADEGVVENTNFIEVTRGDLVDVNIGGTAQKTGALLEAARGGILFVDEAYSLYKDSNQDFGQEAVDTILKYMEDHRGEIMVIFAGYTEEMQNFINMNPGLRSRVPNEFNFEDYSPEEIAEIGYRNLLDQDYEVDEQRYKDIVMSRYSHTIDESNARWVRNFNQELISVMVDRVLETESTDHVTITEEDLDNFTGGNQEEKQKHIDEQLAQLEGLVGLDNVKNEVASLIKEAQADRILAKANPMMSKPSYHMVFEGNPGTGKTTVAEIIAKLFYNLDILPSPNVKVVERSDLVGSYIGHTEKNTKRVIEEAMGGVLFVDEAYQLMSAEGSNDFGKQAIETLLTALENYRDKFVVIFAGYTAEMEQFLNANPGLRSRVQKKIIFPDYSPQEVAQIVANILAKSWTFNEAKLKAVVSEIYQNLPAQEKANGRWARNFSEEAAKQQKVFIVDNDVPLEDMRTIKDTLFDELLEAYRHK